MYAITGIGSLIPPQVMLRQLEEFTLTYPKLGEDDYVLSFRDMSWKLSGEITFMLCDESPRNEHEYFGSFVAFFDHLAAIIEELEK
jgi:hypothetical protein